MIAGRILQGRLGEVLAGCLAVHSRLGFPVRGPCPQVYWNSCDGIVFAHRLVPGLAWSLFGSLMSEVSEGLVSGTLAGAVL